MPSAPVGRTHNARKAPERRGQVLVVNAAHLYRRGRNQNTLLSEHVDQIHEWSSLPIRQPAGGSHAVQ